MAKAENITAQPFDAVIFHGDRISFAHCVKPLPRGMVQLFRAGFCPWRKQYPSGTAVYRASLSVNTAAAGGNASLMTIG